MKIPAQRYGETRSGKAICTYTTDSPEEVMHLVADFSSADIFDAMALLQYLAIRLIRRLSTHGNDFHRFEWYHGTYLDRLSNEELQAEKCHLSLVTSFDITKYGQGRADHLFID